MGRNRYRGGCQFLFGAYRRGLGAEPDDPGSLYAIGSAAGGHEAVHPQLGRLEDFRRLLAACGDHGPEIALDFAVQCFPNHPWLTEHGKWFKRRPDGSIISIRKNTR